MSRVLSVRNSLLAISVLWTVTVLWLTTLFWLEAQDQRADSLRISESTEIGDLLLASAREFAAERVITHAALNAKDEIAPADHETIMAHRRRADHALTQARTRRTS